MPDSTGNPQPKHLRRKRGQARLTEAIVIFREETGHTVITALDHMAGDAARIHTELS